MFFKKAAKIERRVILRRDVLDSILSYCQMKHPNEGVLILKGKSKKGVIAVDGLVIPPFSHSGPTFAGFPHSFLPFDMSYVGMVHSHPSGSAEPSVTDLHNFFGLVSVIVGFPYKEESVFAWDSGGRGIQLEIEPARDGGGARGADGAPAGDDAGRNADGDGAAAGGDDGQK